MVKPFLINCLYVGLGGFFGAIMRYGVSFFVAHQWPAVKFPYATLSVNMIGCFLIGIFIALADIKGVLTPQLRLCLVIGFLGSLTTFSSFANESYILLRQDNFVALLCNIAVQIICGIILVGLGYLCIK